MVIDCRLGSATSGHPAGAEFASDQRQRLWVTPGLNHTLRVFSATTQVLHGTTYRSATARTSCVVWNDQNLTIARRLGTPPSISAKDAGGDTVGGLPIPG